MCFIGYKDIDIHKKVMDVKKYASDNDWLASLKDEEIMDHINNMIGYSDLIHKETKKYQIQYFDTSSAFDMMIQRCIKYLME